MRRERERIRWPDLSCWAAFLRCGFWLTLLWVVVYGGACWITSLHDFRVRLHFDFELAMPFVPAASLIYLSLFPMLWMSPFVFQSAQRLQSFAGTLAILFVLSGVGFLILPGEWVYAPQQPSGFIGRVHEFADWINLSHNFLPSLHVGMAVVCAYTYSRHTSKTTATFFWIWAVAITISTLVTHQHYLADLAAGGILGYVIAKKTYRT